MAFDQYQADGDADAGDDFDRITLRRVMTMAFRL